MEPHHSYLMYLSLLLTCMAIPIIAQTTSTSTASTDASTAPNPTVTLVSGDADWELVGCYNELPASASGRALGLNGSYISPILSSPDALTVALCLEGCRVALSPNGGEFIYAGVENSVECYCGLTLSPLSTPQGRVSCSSPCAADPSTSCGGNGYLTLYERRSAINATSTTISPPSSTIPTPNATSTTIPSASSTSIVPTKKPLPMALIWIGIALGLLLLTLLVALLLHLEKRLYTLRLRHRAMAKLALTIKGSPNPLQAPSFIGGYKLSQPNPAMVSRTRSGHAVPNGRRFGIVGDAGVAVTPLPLLVQPPRAGFGFEFEFQTEAAGKRHRDTFEAWKRGVVPPLKPEDAVEKVNPKVEGTRGGKNAKDLTLGRAGLGFIGKSSGEEKALPKTPKTPKTPMAGLSGVDAEVDLGLDFGMGSENESFDRGDSVKGNESEESPSLGISTEEEGKAETALEESGNREEELERSEKGGGLVGIQGVAMKSSS